MKESIAIIGANDFQNPLILKAKELGYTTHVFAWQCGDIGERTADYFYPISIVEKERILDICRAIRPVGVVSIASDLASITVNYVAEGLGLCCNGTESALLSTNKHHMRRAFEKADLPSCRSLLIDGDTVSLPPDMNYPLIVKPTDRSGSRGIFKVSDPEDLPRAVALARTHSFEKKVLIEEFAEGREYSIEYISWQGEHHFIACTEKFTTGAPLFVETGHLQPPLHMTEAKLREIQALVPRVLDCLGVRFGASHTELKIADDGTIKLIECGARMGGDCIGSDLVYLSTGIDFVGAAAAVACGHAPDLSPHAAPRHAAIRFIFNQQDLDNMERLCARYPSAIYRQSDISPIDGHEISDSSTRYGFYILTAENMDHMTEMLRMLDLDLDSPMFCSAEDSKAPLSDKHSADSDGQKKIMILGAGIYQVPLILEAKSRGLYTVVASIPGNYPGFALADKVYYTDTTDKQAILDIARREKIDAIATTGTDVAVASIGYVCQQLGLPGIGEKAARILTDKALMKEAFVNGGVNTAPFVKVHSYDEALSAAEKIGLPVMLKIVDKSGSRGISKINSLSQLRSAWDYAQAATRADYMVVEKFISGQEIGIDAFVQNGKLLLMLPHDKYVYQSGRTGIPIGHYCPMEMSDRLYNNMLAETTKIIRATGMDNCAINIDAFILPDESVNIIEAAGRCGATGIPEVITGYTGRNYYGCIIDNALGIEVEPFQLQDCRPTASLLLFSKDSGILREVRYSFAGREYINENADIPGFGRVELSFSPGDDIDAFNSGVDRIGQAVFYAASNKELQEAVDSFRHSLRVTVEN